GRELVLLAGVHPGAGQRVRVAQVGHPDRAVGAVAGRGEAFVAFGADEVLFDLGVGPALAAVFGRPFVVVLARAAGEDLRVDRASAAEDLALGERYDPVVAVFLRHAGVSPVVFAAGQFRESGGHVDERVAVAAAGFQQQDAHGGVFGQTRGQHAAGGAAAGDDVVVGVVRCHGGSPLGRHGCAGVGGKVGGRLGQRVQAG